MNLRLEDKVVQLETLVGENTLQTVVEGSLNLPARMPAIARVVRVAAKPVLGDIDVAENQVSLQGRVDVTLVYAAAAQPHAAEEPKAGGAAQDIEGEEGPAPQAPAPTSSESLHRAAWKRAIPFELVLDVAGARSGMAVDAHVAAENVEVELHADGDGLDVNVLLTGTGRVLERQQVGVTTKGRDFGGKYVSTAEEVLHVEDVAGRGQTRLSVEGLLTLDEGQPDAVRVLDVEALATVHEVHVSDGKVSVRGTVDYAVTFVPAGGGVVARTAWQDQTPFSYTFDLPGARAETAATAAARVVGVEVDLRTPSQVAVYTDLDISVRAAHVRSLTLLSAIKAEGEVSVEARTDAVGLQQFVGASEREIKVRGTVEIPDGRPGFDRVVGHRADTRVNEVLVLGDKVAVEGQVDVSLLYVGRAEGDPLHEVVWNNAIPLEFEVSVPGAQPQMRAEVDLRIAELAVDVVNRETAEIEATVRAGVRLSRWVEKEILVEAVGVPPADPDPPTLTFVVVQAGDTLWKLSRRYHTTIESILRANPDIEGEDAALSVGQKVCVPRKRPVAAAS